MSIGQGKGIEKCAFVQVDYSVCGFLFSFPTSTCPLTAYSVHPFFVITYVVMIKAGRGGSAELGLLFNTVSRMMATKNRKQSRRRCGVFRVTRVLMKFYKNPVLARWRSWCKAPSKPDIPISSLETIYSITGAQHLVSSSCFTDRVFDQGLEVGFVL